jgi:hypothetical protein
MGLISVLIRFLTTPLLRKEHHECLESLLHRHKLLDDHLLQTLPILPAISRTMPVEVIVTERVETTILPMRHQLYLRLPPMVIIIMAVPVKVVQANTAAPEIPPVVAKVTAIMEVMAAMDNHMVDELIMAI